MDDNFLQYDFMMIKLPDGSIVTKPMDYIPKQGETIVLEEIVVTPKDEPKVNFAQFAKKNVGFLFVGILGYYALKYISKAPILP